MVIFAMKISFFIEFSFKVERYDFYLKFHLSIIYLVLNPFQLRSFFGFFSKKRQITIK